MTRGLVWFVYCVLLNPCVSIWWFNYHCDSCSFYSMWRIPKFLLLWSFKWEVFRLSFLLLLLFFWNRHLFSSPLPRLSCQPFTSSKCFQSPANLFTKSLSDLLARSPPLLTRLKKNAGRSPLECWEVKAWVPWTSHLPHEHGMNPVKTKKARSPVT